MKKSISVVPSVAQRLYQDSPDRSLTCHLLTEDLHLPIFPFQNAERHVRLDVINGEESEIRRAVTMALSNDSNEGWFPQSFGDFVRSAAQVAVTYGDASYEVVFDRARHRNPNRERDSEFSFGIELIMPTTVHHIFGRPVQFIPAADAKEIGRRLIWLDKSKTFTLALPGISRGRWLGMLRALAALDESSHNAALVSRPGFDFSKQQEFLREAQLFITRPIPWIQGGSLRPESMSDVYGLYRWLLMRGFIFTLRERIVDLLNRMLSAAGDVKNFSATISVIDLPRQADVDQAISDLLVGRDSTDSILRRFI